MPSGGTSRRCRWCRSRGVGPRPPVCPLRPASARPWQRETRGRARRGSAQRPEQRSRAVGCRPAAALRRALRARRSRSGLVGRHGGSGPSSARRALTAAPSEAQAGGTRRAVRAKASGARAAGRTPGSASKHALGDRRARLRASGRERRSSPEGLRSSARRPGCGPGAATPPLRGARRGGARGPRPGAAVWLDPAWGRGRAPAKRAAAMRAVSSDRGAVTDLAPPVCRSSHRSRPPVRSRWSAPRRRARSPGFRPGPSRV